MNIAIDIDDTLTDSFAYFQPFVAEFFEADLETLKAQNISYSNLPPRWKPRELDFCKVYYDRVVPDTPFKPGAREAVAALKARGHRIVIITGRTTAFYTDPYATTEAELKKGGIAYDRLICTLDKDAACREENIALLIDDLETNCSRAAGTGARVLLFTSPANRDTPSQFRRVENWTEVLKAIEDIETTCL